MYHPLKRLSTKLYSNEDLAMPPPAILPGLHLRTQAKTFPILKSIGARGRQGRIPASPTAVRTDRTIQLAGHDIIRESYIELGTYVRSTTYTAAGAWTLAANSDIIVITVSLGRPQLSLGTDRVYLNCVDQVVTLDLTYTIITGGQILDFTGGADPICITIDEYQNVYPSY